MTFDQCTSNCTDGLEGITKMAAFDSIAKNVYLRQLGASTNNYWVGRTYKVVQEYVL